MLETIRQFVEDQHATTGGLGELRDRHAHFYADQVVARWDLWDGPGYDEAVEWVETEFDNLRAGFRWATDQAHLATAVAIAAHTTMTAFAVQQFEPVGWAEELLPAAIAANLPQLPRLYAAASVCLFTGRVDDAVAYAQVAVSLQDEPGYHPFTNGLAAYMEAQTHVFAGRFERGVEIWAGLSAQAGFARVLGICGLTELLPAAGRSDEAIAIADGSMTTARASASPWLIAWAYFAGGRAYTESDPERALDILREGLGHTRQHRLAFWEACLASETAGLEAVHGDIDRALDLFSASIDSFHQVGNTSSVVWVFGHLTVFFEQVRRHPEIAATFCGTISNNPVASVAFGF